MGDLSRETALQTISIYGTDASGNLTNPVTADANLNLRVIDYATSATGSAVPTNASFLGGKNPSGNLQGLLTDASGRLYIDLFDSLGNSLASISQSTGIATAGNFLGVGLNQYIFASTNNSSTANLASGASFTGTADIAGSQSTIDLNFFSDQPCTIKVQQSSDSTHWDVTDTFYTFANIGDGRVFNSIALYWRVIITNNGTSTTTVLRLQSALIPVANPLPRALTQSGNFQVAISETTPFGPNATQIFDDTYDTGLDTTNRWFTPITAGGGVAASNTPGSTALGTGTTANGYSILQSQATFLQAAPGWLVLMNAVNLEFPITLNTYRFWGLGTNEPTPTAASPMVDGIGFEVATTGKMYAVCYSSGTRNVIQDLSSTGNSTQPTDNAVHKYFTWFRGDKAYWAIDEISNQVAIMRTGSLGPTVNNLPLKMLAVAGSVAPGSSGVLTSNAIFLGDTSSTNHQISDGTYQWRKAKVGPLGDISTNTKIALTPSSPTGTSVGTTSGSAVAANTNRKGLVLTNTSKATISIGLGVVAVVNNGITLYPGGVWVMDEFTFTTAAINAIASLVSSNLAIQEFST